MGQLDPEDQDSDDDDLEIGLMGETPKHFAVQVIHLSYYHCDQIPKRNTLRGGSVSMASKIAIYCSGKGTARQSGSSHGNRKQSRTVYVMDRKESREIQKGARARWLP